MLKRLTQQRSSGNRITLGRVFLHG